MVKIKELKVMVAGTVPSVIKFIASEFDKAGLKTEKVLESVDILPKIDELNPDLIVIDIQMEEVSTYEVIEKVKKMKKPRVFMALYSFFIDKDMARESILHRLFASETSHSHQNFNRPIKYLGIFNENTFAHKISAYLDMLKEK